MDGARLDWDDMRIFLAVARTGGLRGAAEALGVNHATVARRLGALEEGLDARLFDRTPSGLTLTPVGSDLIGPAERMELEAHAVRRRAGGRDARPAGPIRVSVPPVLAFTFLAAPLAAFAEAYPEIDLLISITNRFTDLRLGETDVSVRVAFEVDDDVVGRRVVQYAKCVYAAKTYLAARPGLTVGDGAEAEWIGWGDADPRPAWVRASPFPNARIRHQMPEAVLQAEAAAAGMGLTFLPCLIGDGDPRLARAPGVDPYPDRSIWLLLHGDLRRTARVRAFIDFMAEELSALKPALRGETGP